MRVEGCVYVGIECRDLPCVPEAFDKHVDMASVERVMHGDRSNICRFHDTTEATRASHSRDANVARHREVRRGFDVVAFVPTSREGMHVAELIRSARMSLHRRDARQLSKLQITARPIYAAGSAHLARGHWPMAQQGSTNQSHSWFGHRRQSSLRRRKS